jgi:peptidoglycan/LPS O-acetylase OafA/YrhL
MLPDAGAQGGAEPRRRLTIAGSGVLSRSGNSFGLLRLVLAASVIASHTFSIGGFGREPLWTLSRRTMTLGGLAVWGFFGLSGILVGVSASRTPTATYLWHRARRILPAFWICLAVTAFGFAPFIAWVRDLPAGAVSHPVNMSARSYVANNVGLGIHQLRIGSALRGLPYPFAVNGSLWSLAYEATCYLIVLAVVRCWLASQRRDLVIGFVLAVSIFVAFAASAGGRSLLPTRVGANIAVPLLGPLNPALLFPLWAVFMTGTALALWSGRIWLTPALTIVATTVCVASLALGRFVPAGSLALPYALIGIGYYVPARLRQIGVRTDLSYGVFLYGFPVGQALVAFGPVHWQAWSLMLCTLAGALVLASASWFGVERAFLAARRPT